MNSNYNYKKELKIGIGVLANDRPEHLNKLFLALKSEGINEFSIFIDGPQNQLIKSRQIEIQKIISNINWAKINITKRKKILD